MPWKLTEYGKQHFGDSGLEEIISDRPFDWIPNGPQFYFIAEGMGIGCFYKIEDKIFFNETYEVPPPTPVAPVAEWV